MGRSDDIQRDQARKRLEARMRARNEAGMASNARSRRPRNGETAATPNRRRRHSGEDRLNERPRSREAHNASSAASRRASTGNRPRRSAASRQPARQRQGATRQRPRVSKAAPVSPLAKLIALLVILVLIIVLIVAGIRSCSSSSSSTDAASATNAPNTEQSDGAASPIQEAAQAAEFEGGQIVGRSSFAPEVALGPILSALGNGEVDWDYIAIIIGAEYADMLVEQAESNTEAFWIASHPDEYLEDGATVRYKLLKLAAKEPEAVSFVRDWPEKYCADEPDYNESHTDDSSNGVPRFYQWDKRWGYTEYSSTTFALTGCGPTTMAMAYQAITGDTSMDPYTMGVWCVDNGYATAYDGTDSAFFTDGANELGLNSRQIGTDAYSITQALSSGKLVLANVGPGDFTEGGHYFLITGLNSDGTVTINDPYSAVRSAKSWDPELIASQSKAIFSIG